MELNNMQLYVIDKLFQSEHNYHQAYIMGGVRNGKSTLVDLIALHHIESYLPVVTPRVIIVTPMEKQHKHGLLHNNSYVEYMTPRTNNIVGRSDISLIIFDDIEIILARFNNDVDEYDDFIEKCYAISHGNMILIGGMSSLMINYILQNINDDTVLCSVWPSWDANSQLSNQDICDADHVSLYFGLSLDPRVDVQFHGVNKNDY